MKRGNRRTGYSKKGCRILCKALKLKYTFILTYALEYPIRRMCKVLKVHPCGYYAWLKEPESSRAKENKIILEKINEAYEQSNRTYGYRNIHRDLIESGIQVNKKRVARLMREHKLYGVGTVKKRPKHKSGKPHHAHPNHLQQCFIATKPNALWVIDITYIRTYEGWLLYLAVILDLFSRKVIGWSMSHRMTRQLALDAFYMAAARRDIGSNVILHSDIEKQEVLATDFVSM